MVRLLFIFKYQKLIFGRKKRHMSRWVSQICHIVWSSLNNYFQVNKKKNSCSKNNVQVVNFHWSNPTSLENSHTGKTLSNGKFWCKKHRQHIAWSTYEIFLTTNKRKRTNKLVFLATEYTMEAFTDRCFGRKCKNTRANTRNQKKKVSMQTISSGFLEWLTVELLKPEVEEKTSALMFSSKKEPREPQKKIQVQWLPSLLWRLWYDAISSYLKSNLDLNPIYYLYLNIT